MWEQLCHQEGPQLTRTFTYIYFCFSKNKNHSTEATAASILGRLHVAIFTFLLIKITTQGQQLQVLDRLQVYISIFIFRIIKIRTQEQPPQISQQQLFLFLLFSYKNCTAECVRSNAYISFRFCAYQNCNTEIAATGVSCRLQLLVFVILLVKIKVWKQYLQVCQADCTLFSLFCSKKLQYRCSNDKCVRLVVSTSFHFSIHKNCNTRAVSISLYILSRSQVSSSVFLLLQNIVWSSCRYLQNRCRYLFFHFYL